MALYSVWDWDRNAWAIYRNARPVSVGDDPKAPKPVRLGPLGADPDSQMNPLPADARFVGYDHLCRGEVRRRVDGPLEGLGIDMPNSEDLTKYVIGGIVGALAAWYWRRR